MRAIQIEDVGPIEKLTIPLPDAGVVVLRGRNGAGKSHALAAVDSLVSGRGRPPCRDGRAKGVVEGIGARLTIGRSQRRTGEAEVVTLEGRLDISQLVQPPIKDEESADRTRIKALIQLSGAVAETSAFEAILPLGTTLGELVGRNSADDPVALAGQIKRALEAEARKGERAAEDAAAKAAVLKAEADRLPSDDPGSPAEAQAAYQQALVALKEIETRADEARRRAEQARRAEQGLASLRAQAQAASVESLEAEAADLDGKIGKLEQALAVARERRAQVRRQLDQARATQSQIAQLERLITEAPPLVDPARIAEARAEVDRAKARIERAILAQRRRELLAEADRRRGEAEAAAAAASRYRDAAAATDGVLSDLVGKVTSRLRVEMGRLVCDTDRGAEAFGDLSPGERWRVALEIAAEQVGRGGLVTVPQEAWESLDPVNRSEVAAIASRVGVVILTAEADSCSSITPDVFGEVCDAAHAR